MEPSIRLITGLGNPGEKYERTRHNAGYWWVDAIAERKRWDEKNASTGAAVNGASNAPLLDTFDAESTGSSNGGLEVSSAATSTTDANPSQYGNEDAQVAQAMKESEDEAG